MNPTRFPLSINIALFVCLIGLTSGSSASDHQAIRNALQSDIRTAEETARDNERKPVETLSFFGLKPTMTVVELMPGNGWYTKVLGKTLEKQGKLHLALATSRVENKLETWGLNDVTVLEPKAELAPTDIRYVFDIKGQPLPINNIDMVLTFRNTHNLTADARTKLHSNVFESLKPGGIYGIVDHSRRHMQPYSLPVWRRLDPIIVIKEALDAGFEFVDYSNLHYQPDDKLIYDTRDEHFQGPSDRFTLKFRKPE